MSTRTFINIILTLLLIWVVPVVIFVFYNPVTVELALHSSLTKTSNNSPLVIHNRSPGNKSHTIYIYTFTDECNNNISFKSINQYNIGDTLKIMPM